MYTIFWRKENSFHSADFSANNGVYQDYLSQGIKINLFFNYLPMKHTSCLLNGAIWPPAMPVGMNLACTVLVTWDVGERHRHLCLHALTILSASPDVTQCLTGDPEPTKRTRKPVTCSRSINCADGDPESRRRSSTVSWLVAGPDLGRAFHPTSLPCPLCHGLLTDIYKNEIDC